MAYPEYSFKPKDYSRVSMLAKQRQQKADKVSHENRLQGKFKEQPRHEGNQQKMVHITKRKPTDWERQRETSQSHRNCNISVFSLADQGVLCLRRPMERCLSGLVLQWWHWLQLSLWWGRGSERWQRQNHGPQLSAGYITQARVQR